MSANFKSRFMNRMEHITRSGHTSSQNKSSTSTPSQAQLGLNRKHTPKQSSQTMQEVSQQYAGNLKKVQQYAELVNLKNRAHRPKPKGAPAGQVQDADRARVRGDGEPAQALEADEAQARPLARLQDDGQRRHLGLLVGLAAHVGGGVGSRASSDSQKPEPQREQAAPGEAGAAAAAAHPVVQHILHDTFG